MKQSKTFSEFASERREALLDAIGLMETMRHSMPPGVFAAHLNELRAELKELSNPDVINIAHLRLRKAMENV